MATQTRNIIVGAAAIYLSVATKQDGTAAAALPVLGAGDAIPQLEAASVTWKDVGFTSEGLELSYEPSFGEVVVDQSLDAARLFKQSMKVSIKTSFAEATLNNLFIVMNQASGLSGTAIDAGGTGSTVGTGVTGAQSLEIQGGALGDAPVERSLVAVGQAPRSATATSSQRVYYASRVLSVDTSAHSVKRDGATMFPVTFRLLPVASTSNAYGRIIDRTF